MDTPIFKTLRICPTTQQGGTQTIQQSIYLTHNNPCGANLLIFQEMGLTKIRYVDLKNYVDDILKSEEMIHLFDEIQNTGTIYINDPVDSQKTMAYLYAIQQWAQASINNLPLPVTYFPGYRFRINVYDASGTVFYDSFYPRVKNINKNNITNLYNEVKYPLLPSYPSYFQYQVSAYKISTNYQFYAFIDVLKAFDLVFSNFPRNQASLPEAVMAIASLLVDSANTRSFGIPKYGFSARSNLSGYGGITYNCAHFIDIRTVPNEEGKTTLIESFFFSLSLEEDTYYITNVNELSMNAKEELMRAHYNKDLDTILRYRNLALSQAAEEPSTITDEDDEDK